MSHDNLGRRSGMHNELNGGKKNIKKQRKFEKKEFKEEYG